MWLINKHKRLIAWVLAIVAGTMLFVPPLAYALGGTSVSDSNDAGRVSAIATSVKGTSVDGANGSKTYVSDTTDAPAVEISKEKDAAAIAGFEFALTNFSRSNKGTARSVDNKDYGYRYPLASQDALAVLALDSVTYIYVPADVAKSLGLNLYDTDAQHMLTQLIQALDDANSNGGTTLAQLAHPAVFTSEPRITWGAYTVEFGLEVESGYYYAAINAAGTTTSPDVASTSAVTSAPDTTTSPDVASGEPADLSHVALFCETGILAPASSVNITATPEGWAALEDFLGGIDYRPFWVSLRTSAVAMIFVFILGLAAARLSLRVNSRVKDILDAIFTIPMVLPPTVCGFLLLVAFGNSTAFGRWLIDHGIELVFSWPAAVIAAVVVSFPLMYRTTRGAFEAQDSDMLDAARTLGWGEQRIFFRLMLPLAWPSIAAGTVLAFARAMGEFGATLFVAGNYAGVTQTMPIAIYFQWMGGRTDVATFWVVVVILISFIVILFINLYASHTQRFRKRGANEDDDNDTGLDYAGKEAYRQIVMPVDKPSASQASDADASVDTSKMPQLSGRETSGTTSLDAAAFDKATQAKDAPTDKEGESG
ncbi:MAG: molybdate ABC transporter permease subunit [Coriobacteriales bacterium]|jgi:molybdate transport system permease protein|nr:molybdate ABC transporter permease subunit [Coriobacteriales bacterium]